MTIQDIAKLKKQIDAVQKLDAEIIDLEKMAMMVAEGDMAIRVELTATDFTKADEGKDTTVESEIHDAVYRALTNRFYRCTDNKDGGFTDAQTKHSYLLKDTIAMRVIGTILYDKIALRKSLIEQIEKA